MMGEELKGRIEHLLRHYEVRWDSIDFSLNEAIAALVTEEVDAMKEDAENIFYEAQIEAYPNKAKNLGMTVEQLQKWNRWVCDIAEEIRRLTPSTAQSREREIRIENSARELVEWQREHGGPANYALFQKLADAIESASSQLDGPGSREREIRQARLEVGQHMLEVFNRGMTGEGIGKYFDGYVENLAAELSASSQPK